MTKLQSLGSNKKEKLYLSMQLRHIGGEQSQFHPFLTSALNKRQVVNSACQLLYAQKENPSNQGTKAIQYVFKIFSHFTEVTSYNSIHIMACCNTKY
jgi:hypothetical protein